MARPKMKEIGTYGLKRSGNILTEEWDNALKGSRKNKIYREMADGDATVGAILYAIENLAKTTKWSFKPRGESAVSKTWATNLNDNIHKLDGQTWEETVAEILSMLTYGWSFHEINYRKEGGVVKWRNFPIRAQESLWEWELAPNGDVLAFWQQDPNTMKRIRIPIEKGLLFRTRSHKNNPEGRSILRSAYRSWYIKKHIESIEAVGIERNLAGIPVAYIPAEIISAAEEGDESAAAMYTTFKDIVSNIRNDEMAGIVLPQQWTEEHGKEMYKLDLLSGNFQKAIETNQIIERYDQRIAASVLADLIFMGSGGSSGSWALGSTKEGMLQKTIDNYLDSVASVFNSKAIPRLMQLNGVKEEDWPILEHSSLQGRDLAALSRYVHRLAGAGFTFTEEEQQDLKSLIGSGQDHSMGNEGVYATSQGSNEKIQ